MSGFNHQPDVSFAAGERYRRGEHLYHIAERTATDIVLQRDDTSERRKIGADAFHAAFLKGLFLPWSKEDEADEAALQQAADDEARFQESHGGLTTLSVAAMNTGMRHIKYINELHNRGHNPINKYDDLAALELLRIARELKDENPPALSTIYTCDLKIRKAGGDLRVAFPNYEARGGRNEGRVPQEVVDVLEHVFAELIKHPHEKIRHTRIADLVKAELVVRHGYARAMALAPSQSTVTRRTMAFFGAYEVCRRNDGIKAAKAKYRQTYPRDRATEVGEVVECDDKDLRIFLVDERTGLPYGRAIVTLAVDQASSVPGGIWLGNEPRSTWSALKAIENYVLPKDMNAPHMANVKSQLPYMGRIAIILMDNALQNHSVALEVAAVEIGNAIIQFAKPHQPTEKSGVEGTNGKMERDFLEWLPGHVKAKRAPYVTEEGILSANLTVEELKLLFHQWVYDVYCKKAGKDGFTPEQRWLKGMEGRIARVPSNIDDVKLAVMLTMQQQIHADGIRFKDIPYTCEPLVTLRKNHGDRFRPIFRYAPDDLSYIRVLNPETKKWIFVPSARPTYTQNRTLYQHQLVQKILSESKNKNPSEEDYLRALAELARRTRAYAKSKKLVERQASARAGKIEVVTELEGKMNELNDQPNEVETEPSFDFVLDPTPWARDTLNFVIQ